MCVPVCVCVCVCERERERERALGGAVCVRHNLTAFACTGSGVQAAPRLAVHFKVVIEGFGLFVVFNPLVPLHAANMCMSSLPGDASLKKTDSPSLNHHQ